MVQTPEESLLQLQTLWLKCSNEVESVVKKEELLKEFLYKVYCVNFELPQETKLITSFLSTVLEDICSFLLERVHQIISKSKLFSESEDNVDKDDDCVHTMETTTSDKTKILRDKHNFAQLVLRAPSDYGKIVALRTFLTHEIGHHILYFLRSVNIKLLASQSSLCNLCINLFPNCRWEDNQNNVDSSSSLESMQAFVESIQVHLSSQQHHLKKLAEPKDLFNRGIQQNDACVESEYTAYVQQVRTSDEIAAVLIDLLIKCVDVEYEMVLSDQSMSVVCWKFAIEKLAAKDETFASDNNGKVIKRKLLRLTAKCFNNACCHKDNFGLLDLKCTIAKLMNALTENANQEIIFGINYLVFSLINNVIIQSDGKLHDAIRFVDEEILDKYVASLIAVMNRPQMEINPLFGSFIDVLLRIIDNTNKVLRTKAKKVRKKFKYDIQRHCNRSNFPCFFQKLLFNILEHLSSELQKQVLRYLHRQGICCCLCNIGTMQVLLSRSIHHANRRIALDFIHKKILQTVLVRNGCEMCDFKYKSSEFNRSITMAYYNAVICMDGPDEIHCYIRHFRHISHVINGDMAVCIMGTIVLPVFRQNINCAANKSNSVPLLLECLNTFVAYLIDTRLIKAFYNNDNISLLQNLMYQHEFTRCVSDLMRIGIDFGSFLGEEANEQNDLYNRLLKMQLSACKKTMNWVNGMLSCLKQNEQFVMRKEIDCTPSKDLKPLHILNMAYRFWSNNYDLIKRNRLYAKEFILNFSTDDLIDWSCSLLYSFLHYLNEMAKSDSENADMQRFNDEFLRLQESPVASKDKTVLVTEGMPHFDDVIRSYSSNEGKSFLNELHKGNVMEESIVLFDIRNQMSSSSCSSAFEDLLWLSREDSPPAESHSGILGRLFGFIFGARQISGNASPEKTPTNEEDLHLQLHSLTEPGECKDLLLSLFESTFAVYMRLCNGTVTEAMQKNLRKIKSIILSKAVTDWENEETATLAVLQALQSLLKIAELSGSSAKSPDKEREYETPATAGAVEERTLASTESEGDFFSTRASLVCGDSEVELSENETEEFYQTADEGYEADGEIPENSESDDEVADPWTGFTPVSRYRTNVVHDGICKIVVEILFELSTKCVSSFTHAWSSTLSQLASRMFAIRNLLGGPLFLLQGFAPVLQCHGPEFKDLQESILDLILDLNSPDVLTTYFSILATKNPPIDILMRYLFFISTSMLKKQPSVEMSFPILNDGKCVSSERTQFVEEIERVRNYHLCNNASTLFLKSPCLLPITHGKLWGPFGLTVSLWMQMNSNTHQKSSATVIEDDSKAVYDDSLRTHVFSVGSNQAMISVYVNGNMNLVFECCRPNAELSPKCSPNETAKDENSSNNKENVPLNVTPPHNASPFRNALKQTKKVILNSFNPMHLFHGHGVGDGYFEGSSVELKYFRLCRNKWTHLCLAIDVAPDRFNITLIADGLEQHSICLPFRNVRNLTRTSTFQLLSLGDSLPKPSTEGSHAALDVLLSSALKFSISNLILFNRKIADREVVLNLTAMGPDFIDLTQCQVGGWKPNFGYLNLNKSYNVNTGNFHDAMKVLKQSRFLSYSASEPLIFMAYDPTYDRENVTGHKHNIILYGDLQSKPLKSVHTASLLCGGLSCFLYLFARVVEHSCDPSNQASALDLLLQIALSDMQLYTEFLRNDYVSLIGYVIKTEKCTKDVNLLASIVNNACTQPVIMRRGSVPQVNENTVACIAHPILLVSILHRYSDWYRSGAETCEVLETLFKSILALVRDKHPCKEFNIKQLNRVGVVKELLNLCKVYVVESPNPVYISVEAANSFANILSVFAGSPPSASLMDEIMKLLLLLHKPSECFVVHSRSNFYFLLKPTENGKTTEHSVPRRPFGPLFGERSRLNSRDTADDENARFRRFSFEKSPRTKNFNFASLEKIADCSRLNKKAVQSLSPSDCSSWRTPLRRHSMVHMPSNGSLGIRPHGMIRKRTRTRSRSTSSSEKRLRSETTPDSCADCSFGTNSIASESVSSIHFPSDSSVLHQMKSKSLCQVDFSQLPGIIKLQERLFTLLKDFLCLLPDNVVEEVLAHYVKIEIILALANHWSPNIRAAILKLLSALSKRVSANELAAISKKFYPQLLANQLAIHPTDAHMLETCLEWVTGLYGVLDGFNNYECITIQNKLGLNALLAILTQAVGLCDHAAKGFKVLRIIYLTDPESNQCLLENGLLQCCVKALYNMYTKATVPSASMENSIIELLTLVGEKAFKTVGQVNIIWDILNMLYFHQESNLINVIKGFRSVQGKLQLNWLKLFFSEQRPSSGFKVTLLPNSSLTLPETKTRLDLLIDRCSQFFTSFGPNYMPSDNEVKLFELLVSYGISTNTRCNNSIAWGLLASRPVELRQFIIDSLWMSCQNEAPSIMCDGKIIKALLWQCLLEQKESNQHPIQNLDSLCLRLGIRDVDTTWNLEQELERIEHTRHNVAAKQRSLLDKTMQKFESLAENCVETSMAITRVVSELQNSERTNLMNHMKEYDENYTFHKWLEIIRRMTHEGAPWYSINRCETSFELDATEGPSRVHTRMRRCHLDIDKRFIMEEYQKRGGRCDDYIRPLDYLVSSYDQQLNISQNSQILYFFPAKYLPVDAEIDGEIVVTVQKLYFIATYKCKYFYVSCDVANITEIWLKRYQHQEKAFEIFLDSNKSLFFSLQNQEDCKILKDIFLDKIITCPDQNKILLITQQWREGLLTNWEYLMTLNQISGRTYNDLMQYPVFPWILSNYTSDVLDLTDKKNFRKLEKPIAVQHEENEQHYVNNYSYINNTMTNMGTLQLKPYHYSSHYSNSGTVLHFLVRVPPFTSYFLRYQDNNFDLPDRTFHSLATTWSLASKDSPTDVKELIPEFFCLPEMFENSEGFDFGCRQSGERVEDVLLPPWCLRDPRLFVLIHRQALESEMVRQNIHHWIDLIFGHNQTGQNAVDAINVFHPATYAVFLESEITDPIERKAVETMIKTYGQMPKQLFKSPHPSSKPFNYCLGTREVIPTVKGLRWGVFLGSPQLPTPSLGHINKLPGAETLVSFNNTNMIYGLSSKSCVMQGPEADTYNVISWGNDDRIVRIQPLNETQTAAKALLYNSPLDEISCCGSDPNSNLLWCGHKSGLINVYKCQSMGQSSAKNRHSYMKSFKLSYNSATFRKLSPKSSLKMDDIEQAGEAQKPGNGTELIWSGPTALTRHTDEVTSICLSVEFKIAVSAGRDGLAVIWDLNDLSYVRTIERPAEIHHSPISLTAISPTLGDIVTVHTIPKSEHDPNITAQADECFEVTEESLDDFVNVSVNPNGKSILRLHTVNARYVNHIVHEDQILAVCYSYIKEGVGVNVIATAVEGGIIRLWSSWNLSLVIEIVTGISNIKSITYSTHQHLVVLTKDSYIQVWEAEGLYGNPPKFPQIVFK